MEASRSLGGAREALLLYGYSYSCDRCLGLKADPTLKELEEIYPSAAAGVASDNQQFRDSID
jgi:hypothetical protein